jgi:hypothetical protein
MVNFITLLSTTTIGYYCFGKERIVVGQVKSSLAWLQNNNNLQRQPQQQRDKKQKLPSSARQERKWSGDFYERIVPSLRADVRDGGCSEPTCMPCVCVDNDSECYILIYEYNIP